MNPFKERSFHKIKDSSFKITLLIGGIPFLNNLFLYTADLLIIILKFFSRKSKNHSNRLIIICLHRLGDTVFCIPAIDGILKRYKNFDIKILSYPETKSILEIKYDSSTIVTLDKNEFKLQRRFAKAKNRKIVKELMPEIIFDFTGNPASASFLLSSGAKKIIGTNLLYFRKLYTTFVPIRKTPHYIDIYLDVLKAAYPGYKDYTYEFECSLYPDGKIMIHPFAIRKVKEWNFKKYIELAIRLNRKYEVYVILPPGFISDDTLYEIRLLQLNVQITNTIKELIDIIKEASIFISNDSGPIYIANLLGKPTFTIYGPTNPKFSLPFGKYHRYYQKNLSCITKDDKVCFTLGGINCPEPECMNQIDINEIENIVTAFISDLGIRKKNKVPNNF